MRSLCLKWDLWSVVSRSLADHEEDVHSCLVWFNSLYKYANYWIHIGEGRSLCPSLEKHSFFIGQQKHVSCMMYFYFKNILNIHVAFTTKILESFRQPIKAVIWKQIYNIGPTPIYKMVCFPLTYTCMVCSEFLLSSTNM